MEKNTSMVGNRYGSWGNQRPSYPTMIDHGSHGGTNFFLENKTRFRLIGCENCDFLKKKYILLANLVGVKI